MANTPISGFTNGAPAQADDEFVIARQTPIPSNFKLKTSDLATYIGANGAAGTNGQIQYNNSGAFGGLDLYYSSATLRLGAADAASAVAQTLQVQSSTGAGTTGPNFTIKGSAGTTAGGSIIFQTAATTSYAAALTLTSAQNAIFAGSLMNTDTISGIIPNSGGTFYIDVPTNGLIVRNNAGAYAQVITLATSGALTLGPTSAAATIVPDAANTLALRNSTSPQLFRVYSTTASSGSYGIVSAGVQPDGTTVAADTLYIGSAGAGAAMTKLALVVNGTSALSFSGTAATFAGTVNFPASSQINSSGTYQAGGTGTPSNAFASTGVFLASSAYIQWAATNSWTGTGDTFLYRGAAGLIGLNGNTSSFPGLKNGGAALQVRLADNSANAALTCGTTTSGGTALNVTGTGDASIMSVTNTSTGTLLQVLNSTSNPLMTVTDTTSGTLFSVQSTTAATLFSVNDTTSGTLLAVTNSSSQDIFSVSDAGVFGADGASANVLAIKNSTTEQRLRIYNTTASSGSYFFVGAGVNDDGTVSANTLNIGTGGAGAVLSKFAVVVNGTTRLDYNVSSTSNWTASGTMRAQAFEATNSDFKAPSGGYFYWATRAQMKSPADKVMVVEDSAAGPAIIQTKQFIVTNLPAATSYAGAMAFVSDATATTPRSTVAGGGSNKVMVMSDGTNWLIVA